MLAWVGPQYVGAQSILPVWQVPNLFVTDGAAFVSNADKNPTLSIMANAWRSADYLVQEMRAQFVEGNP